MIIENLTPGDDVWDGNVSGGPEANRVRGLAGDDYLDLENDPGGVDTLSGGAGNDTLVSWSGADVLLGGRGSDYLVAWQGGDRDTLSGGDGDDVIWRGSGDLSGGAGDDVIRAYSGSRLSGGDGADRFALIVGDDDTVRDFRSFVIRDFERGSDKIDLTDLIIFMELEGGLEVTPHFTGHEPFDGVAGHIRIFRAQTSDSRTRVDADLNGDAVVDLVVILKGVTELSADDFVV